MSDDIDVSRSAASRFTRLSNSRGRLSVMFWFIPTRDSVASFCVNVHACGSDDPYLGLLDSPNERVLVIFGAGHLGWLRHNVARDRSLRLRKLAEFAK